MSPILHSLNWLPIRQRVTFKIALLVWKCVHDAAPAGTLSQGRRRPRVSTATVCIYSMYHLWGRQRDSDFSVPWAVNLEQFAINSVRSCWVVCLWQRSKCGWRHIPSIINNNEHYPALLGRFVVVVPSIKLMFSFIYIYLFTYAFDSKTCSCDGDRTFTGAEPRVWARPTHH